MKNCFKCGRVLPLTEYYVHKRMADGHLNKCKACTRADIAEYRRTNPEVIRVKKAAWARTEKGKATMQRVVAKRKVTHPEQVRANTMVGNAIKLGKLVRQPCFICGDTKSQGHHPDYSSPLDVVWLCKKHHVETHKLAKQLQQKEGF